MASNSVNIETKVDLLLPTASVEAAGWFKTAINQNKVKYARVRPSHFAAISTFYRNKNFRPAKWNEKKAEIATIKGKNESQFNNEDWLLVTIAYHNYVDVYAKNNLDQVLREFGFLI